MNGDCEKFKMGELTNDQFRCLLFVCGRRSRADTSIRMKLINLVEEEETRN